MSRGSVFWGLLLILIGILFLLTTSGLLNGIDPWKFIWPIFLIAIGLWFFFGTLFGRWFTSDTKQVVIPLEGATSALIKITHGAGKMTLNSHAAPGELLTGSFVRGLKYKIDHRRSDVQLKLQPTNNTFPFMNWGWSQGLNWNFCLNPDIPLSLDIGTGANESVLDLTELKVNELHLHTGASATRLSLPMSAGYTRVTCEAGLAGLVIVIPTSVAARIQYHGGLSTININTNRFLRKGSVYQSADFDTSDNKVDILIQMGLGSVEIR